MPVRVIAFWLFFPSPLKTLMLQSKLGFELFFFLNICGKRTTHTSGYVCNPIILAEPGSKLCNREKRERWKCSSIAFRTSAKLTVG